MKGWRNTAILLIVLLGVVGAGYYFSAVNPIFNLIQKGLDLAGGFHVELIAVDSPQAPVTEEKMQKARDIIAYRVDRLGVTEPTIRRKGDRRIVVELPGVKDPEEALDVIGRTALLEFVDPEGNVVLTGEHLKNSNAELQETAGITEPVVTLEFDAEGARKFGEATTRLVGQRLAIRLDQEVISAPQVRDPITTGHAVITNIGSMEDAKQLMVLLNSGSLPIEMETLRPRFISAILGQDSIDSSRNAAVLGVAAIIGFMFLFYRIPGFWADVALAVYIMLLLGILAAIKAVLTLPGIAGIILSIGMAVDANVIIFERIKEELRLGKTIRSAIDSGFTNAIRAIVDGNLTTLIVAAVLFFYFQSGPLRGFAVTLFIGIVTSMFTALVVTRFLLRTFVNTGLIRNARALFNVKGGSR